MLFIMHTMRSVLCVLVMHPTVTRNEFASTSTSQVLATTFGRGGFIG